MKIQDDEVELCPEEFPEGLIEYIREQMLPRDHVLIYKKGNIRGMCFRCREKVTAAIGQRFRKNEGGLCPNCGRWVRFYPEGGSSFKNDYVDNVATIQKGIDGETIFIRQWHVSRDDTARWKNLPGHLEEICRYALRGTAVAKWQKEAKENYWMNVYRYRLDYWTRMKDLSRVYDNGYYFYLPKNWREITAGTSLQYCDIADYMKDAENQNVIRFLSEWVRYPMVEKLWKAGYRTLIEERMNYRATGKPIIWSRPTIQRAIKIPYRLLKQRAPEDWNHRDLWKLTGIWPLVERGSVFEKEIPLLMSSEKNLEFLDLAWGHASVKNILQYVKNCSLYTYRDYLEECVMLGLNLDDRQVLFPDNLDAAHLRTLGMVKHEENEREREAFEKVVKRLLKYSFEQGELLLRPAQSQNELIQEGKALHHCVGGYASRMAKGETSIFLIRKKAEPETPFYTLEWKNERVIQCRTSHNKSYEQDEVVRGFVDNWVKRMKKETTGKVA